MLRNGSRKRALFASWLPKSIIKMFWNFRRKSCFFFMLKFNRQVMTSLSPQNQQKFLLMNMRLCDIHQGDETGVWLTLDDFLFYEWWSKPYENSRASKTEICWEFCGTLKNISGDQGNIQKNFWEQGNLTRVNLREHRNLFLGNKGETPIFSREQGNMPPPPPPGGTP